MQRIRQFHGDQSVGGNSSYGRSDSGRIVATRKSLRIALGRTPYYLNLLGSCTSELLFLQRVVRLVFSITSVFFNEAQQFVNHGGVSFLTQV